MTHKINTSVQYNLQFFLNKLTDFECHELLNIKIICLYFCRNLGSVFNRLSSTSDSGSVCEASGLKVHGVDKGVIDDMRACASDLEDDFDDEDDEDEDSVNGRDRRITTDSK